MGLGSDFSCCSCKNLKKSMWIDFENNKKNYESNNIIISPNKQFENNITNMNANNNNSINDKRRIEEKSTSKFNKKGSQIVNAKLLQPSELKLDMQPQQTDEFDQMFNQLSDISDNNNN